MAERVGLIPAAGRGTRAYPYTKTIPKGMLKVSGKPLLEHLVTLQRDQLGIRRIFIVVGTLGEAIQQYFEDGSNWGVRIEYLQNDAVHLGLAYSVSLGERVVQDPFLLMLSDEVLSGHQPRPPGRYSSQRQFRVLRPDGRAGLAPHQPKLHGAPPAGRR